LLFPNYDNLQSAIRKLVAGEVKPFDSGKSAFRFMILHDQLRQHPLTQSLADKDGTMHMWFGNGRRLIMYPCNDNTSMNFAAIHPSEASGERSNGKFPSKG
jgi:2-polyprenyl-6-methoxyphenol hydroxylase-like FAD-dependent oxidoreductase